MNGRILIILPGAATASAGPSAGESAARGTSSATSAGALRRTGGKRSCGRIHGTVHGIPEPVDFTDVDWTLSDGEIARELNCARESVTRERWRRKSGRSERKVPPESRDWSTIDWRLSDCILAWRLGMDKRAIAEKRMRYSNVPESEISKLGGDA